MSEPVKPTVVLLYGDDRLTLEERVAELIARLGEPADAAASLERFSAARPDLDRLRRHLYAMPFLAPRRMALVELNPLPSKKSESADALLPILDSIPPSSVLVAVEPVDYAEVDRWLRRDRQSGAADAFIRLHARASPVYAWILEHPQQGLAREVRSPRGPAFERWLASHASALQGRIEPEAAAMLREYTGEDTLVADQEMRKLLAYVDGQRAIERPDVERLTPFRANSDIFALVESLGIGDGRQAMQQLRRLLDEEDPRYVFSMVVRQFRLLLLAREALDHGRSPDQVLGTAPHRLPRFVSDRVGRQALRFTGPGLAEIYHELFQLDLASKTGRADLEVGLETLVASLAR